MARYPIHVPYLVNRIRADDPKQIRDTVNAIMEELHRYLRYLQNTSDQTQLDLESLETDLVDLPGQLEQPIRDAGAGAALHETLRHHVPRDHSHPHAHGPEDLRLTHTEGVLPGQIFGD